MGHNYLRPCSPEKKLRQKVAKYKNVPRADSPGYKNVPRAESPDYKKGNVGLAALETLLYLGLTA